MIIKTLLLFFILFATSLASNAETINLYITNQQSNTLSIVNFTTTSSIGATILKTIKTGTSPAGVCINKTHGVALIQNTESGTISVINIKKNSAVAEYKSAIGAVGIACSDEFIFISDWYNSKILKLNYNGKKIKEYTVGKEPAGISLVPNSSILLIAERASNSVGYLNITSGDYHSMPIGKHPFSISVTPEGKLGYVAVVQDNKVCEINIHDAQITHCWGVGDWPYSAVRYKNKLIVSNNHSDTISIVNIDNNSTKTINKTQSPETINIYKNIAFINSWFDGKIYLFDMDEEKMLSFINVGDGPRSLGNFILNN